MSDCIHEWEWNIPPEALDCKKCGEYLDCGYIVEHINALEAQLAAAQSRLAEREWISVGERLPEPNSEYLWWDKDQKCVWFSQALATKLSLPKEFTHWMPLPEAPKEDE